MQKRCTICKQIKELSEFNKNKCKKDGLNTLCKICSQERSKQYYKENKEYHRKYIYERRKKYAADMRIIKNEAKSIGCIKCNEKDVCCLDFHHNDPTKKLYNISALAHRVSKKKLLVELKKCSILCSNCHRKLHAGRFTLAA